jgi:hypothetical protein
MPAELCSAAEMLCNCHTPSPVAFDVRVDCEDPGWQDLASCQLGEFCPQVATRPFVDDAYRLVRDYIASQSFFPLRVVLYRRSVFSSIVDATRYWHVDSHDLIWETRSFRVLAHYAGSGTQFLKDGSSTQARREEIIGAFDTITQCLERAAAVVSLLKCEPDLVRRRRAAVESLIDDKDVVSLAPGDIAYVREGRRFGGLHRAPMMGGVYLAIISLHVR